MNTLNTSLMSAIEARFRMAENDGKINAEQVISILQSLNFNEQQIKSIVSQIDSDINLIQFQKLVQPNEQEIPAQKLTQDQIYSIYGEFKQAINIQNIEKVKLLLDTYQKEIDLINRIDPQTRQISTYLAIQGTDENVSLQLLKLLCDLGANLNFKDQLKQSIAFYICRDGKQKLLDFLIEQGVSIDEPDYNGQTPLFYASRDNRIEIIQKLITLGVDISRLDSLQCQTALFYAALKGNYEVCKMLIDAGCIVNHQDSKKKTALFYARQSQKKEVIELLTAFMSKQKDEVHNQKKEETSKGEQKPNRKKQKEVPKQNYKIMHTDDKGNSRELTNEDFQKFQQQYPEIASLILGADDLIDETMINQYKEDETWEKIAKRLIAQIWKSKGAYIFHKPVDQKEFHIHDYFEIVKRPMDFGTIKNRLNANSYKSCKEFHNDMMQVFDNCALYNGTTTSFGQMGVNVRTDYLGLVDQFGLNKYL